MTSEAGAGTKVTKGIDAAVEAREHDHLNRWSFAKEIYAIAATGPREWSVRIGIYGEWGTGKTSVLNFVRVLAEADSHVVVPFNPWRYRSTDELWREFVRAVFEQLERTLEEPQPGSRGRAAKRIGSDASEVIPKVLRVWREDAGDLAEAGLSRLKRFFSFGPGDLEELEQTLGTRRIIVLIDDLDRTDPKLVPEMLFALKEILDVRGLASVCAFDPNVVGQVLGQFHPGFGDGLRFLEKIIDYPRWLRPPSPAQLAKLAIADAVRYCNYVPVDALARAVTLLPANPRAVRQFVRLLALLRPQVERHDDREIHWPILLAANVLKVRFPHVAPEVLHNGEFWESVKHSTWGTEDHDGSKRAAIIDKEVERIAEMYGIRGAAKTQFHRCVSEIGSKLEAWFGISQELLMYQFRLAEEPCAVTWKEFDAFLVDHWKHRTDVASPTDWMNAHAVKTGTSQDQVFVELFQAAVQARLTKLGNAADALSEADVGRHLEDAASLAALISVLLLDFGGIDTDSPRVSADELRKLLESFAQYASWRTGDAHRKARETEEQLLLQAVSRWGPDILTLVDGIGLNRWEGHHDIRGAEWQRFVEQLRQEIRPKLASWLVARFQSETEFMSNVLHSKSVGHRVRGMFLDPEGALWKERRDEAFEMLDTASSAKTVRGNAYEVLAWIDYLLRKNEPDLEQAARLVANVEIMRKLWSALFAEPLSPRAIGSTLTVFERSQQNGANLDPPPWWKRLAAERLKAEPPQQLE